MKRGIVYACSHLRWFDETIVSAQSYRRHMPDLACQLFITEALLSEVGEGVREHFTDTIMIAEAGHPQRPRFEATLRTDLDQAIFIDSDTFFLAPVIELFELLDHVDIAVAQAPQYFSPKAAALGVFDKMPKVSVAQPEWNTGVIVARVDEKFHRMVQEWSVLFEKCRAVGFSMDQASFRSALVTSRLRFATLPNNYNFRANVENSLAGEVKILHAHGNLEMIGSYINVKQSMRLYTPKREEIYGFMPKPIPRP